MRPSSDGVIRQQWTNEDSSLPRRPPEAIRMSRSIETDAPAVSAAPSPDSDKAYDLRLAAWGQVLEEAADDAAENGDGEISAVELGPWLAANLLQAIDQAVAGGVAQMRTEMGALRRSVEFLSEQRRADRRRHVEARGLLRAKIRELEGRLEDQERTHASEAARWRDELRTLANELAEQRSLDRLRHSRAGRSHAAAVELKLVRAELAKEARGVAS
jgi:hypothetical protein